MCQFYINGFCPNGKICPEGAHPAWKDDQEMEKPRLPIVLSKEEQAAKDERTKSEMIEYLIKLVKEKRYLDRNIYNQLKMQGRSFMRGENEGATRGRGRY